METYPSIPSTPVLGAHVYAFEKIDGSQIRAEWSRKRGFYKVGSRTRLVGGSDLLGQARGLLDGKYARPLAKAFLDRRWERVVCFFELAGPQSFAGSHVPGDALDLTLFDAMPYKRGLLPPEDFFALFSSGPVPIPALVHVGEVTKELLELVRASTGLREGVVCKDNRGGMFKVKTRAWIERVKALHGGDEAKLRELL